VPQPRRIWCLDEDDLVRASALLERSLVVESVVSRRRMPVTAGGDLRSAFALTVGGRRERGAIVEAEVERARWQLGFMVVDGTAHAMPGRSLDDLAPSGRRRAERVARAAVEAVGGSAMAVELTVTDDGAPYVLRVDAAPDLDRVGPEAREALRRAIVDRLAPAQAPPQHALRARAHERRTAHAVRT
jgi:hypothetical protein